MLHEREVHEFPIDKKIGLWMHSAERVDSQNNTTNVQNNAYTADAAQREFPLYKGIKELHQELNRALDEALDDNDISEEDDILELHYRIATNQSIEHIKDHTSYFEKSLELKNKIAYQLGISVDTHCLPKNAPIYGLVANISKELCENLNIDIKDVDTPDNKETYNLARNEIIQEMRDIVITALPDPYKLHIFIPFNKIDYTNGDSSLPYEQSTTEQLPILLAYLHHKNFLNEKDNTEIKETFSQRVQEQKQ